MTNILTDISTELVTVLDGGDGVAILQLNRPQKRNAFTQGMIDAMVVALDRIDRDRQFRVLVVTSVKGSPFSGELISITVIVCVLTRL